MVGTSNLGTWNGHWVSQNRHSMGSSSLSPGLWHGLGGWRQGSRCVNRLSRLSPKGSPDIKVAKVVIPNISEFSVYIIGVWWFLKFFLSIPGSMNRFLGSCVLLHLDIIYIYIYICVCVCFFCCHGQALQTWLKLKIFGPKIYNA